MFIFIIIIFIIIVKSQVIYFSYYSVYIVPVSQKGEVET